MTDITSDNEEDHTLDYEDEEEIEDDEATLDEEDALNNEDDDYGNELKELQEDGELSIEELRRKYCGNEDNKDDVITKTSQEDIEENHKKEDAKTSSLSTTQRSGNIRGKILTAIASTCDAAVNNYFKADELDEDESEDYLPPELWKKEIRVGPDFQVTTIPQVVQISNNDKPDINEKSEALWIASPQCCPETLITDYLIECEQIRAGEKPKNGLSQNLKNRCNVSSSEATSTLNIIEEIVPDDENALFALYSAKYNIIKAKSKAPFEWPALYSINGPKLTQPPGPLRTWTEEECENFEKGMTENGKHFLKIQRDYLPRRTLGEIVNFYYSWKKSQRHNLWRENQQNRLQHVDVKCVDLMGQIAETILRQNQIEENEDKQKYKIDVTVPTIQFASVTTETTTCSTSDNSKISNSSTSSG